MVPLTAVAAGGWWLGFSVASVLVAVLVAVLAALVVTVITLVNRIELQAASIRDSLTAAGGAPGRSSTWLWPTSPRRHPEGGR